MRIDGNDEFYINQYKRGYVHGHYDGYNKAIDDLKEKLIEYGFIFTERAERVYDEIVQQLKERES